MSLGFSLGDVVILVNLTVKVFNGWKNAGSEYSELSGSLENLLIILRRVESDASQRGSVLRRTQKGTADLKDILDNTAPIVQELDELVSRFKAIGSEKETCEKNLDKLQFGLKDTEPLRMKLVHHTTMISAYLDAVGLGSLGRMESLLEAIAGQVGCKTDDLVAGIEADQYEETPMTGKLGRETDAESEFWKQLKQELIAKGIRGSLLQGHKESILNYVKDLVDHGKADVPDQGDFPRLVATPKSMPQVDRIGRESPVSNPSPPSFQRTSNLASTSSQALHSGNLERTALNPPGYRRDGRRAPGQALPNNDHHNFMVRAASQQDDFYRAHQPGSFDAAMEEGRIHRGIPSRADQEPREVERENITMPVESPPTQARRLVPDLILPEHTANQPTKSRVQNQYIHPSGAVTPDPDAHERSKRLQRSQMPTDPRDPLEQHLAIGALLHRLLLDEITTPPAGEGRSSMVVTTTMTTVAIYRPFPRHGYVVCTSCRGSGVATEWRQIGTRIWRIRTIYHTCDGSGDRLPCARCNGKGLRFIPVAPSVQRCVYCPNCHGEG